MFTTDTALTEIATLEGLRLECDIAQDIGRVQEILAHFEAEVAADKPFDSFEIEFTREYLKDSIAAFEAAAARKANPAPVQYADGDELDELAGEDEGDDVVAAPSPAPVAQPAPVAPATPRVKAWNETIDVAFFPDVRYRMTKNGPEPSAPMSTIDNLAYMLERYGIKAAYNEMRKRVEFGLPGHEFTDDNAENAAIAHIKSQARRNGMPITEVKEYLLAIGERNVTHPVREWIESAAWDGVSRMQSLIETLLVRPEHVEHRNAIVKRWLISCVAAAFSQSRSDKFELALVLQGGQGIGKTTFIKRLCHIHGAVKDGFNLDPDNKDHVKQFASHWVVELGELDGIFRKADIAKLKAFLSHTEDEIRLPYMPAESLFKRRTVAAATVNTGEFLTDSTGNRRWGTVPLLGVARECDLDIQQVWAEVKALYDAGEQWHLTPDEDAMLKAVNSEHEAIDPVEELVREAFVLDQAPVQLELVGGGKKAKAEGCLKLTATHVVLGLGLKVDKRTVNEAAAVLRKLAPHAEGRDGKLGKFWLLKPRRMADWGSVVNG